MKPADPRFRFLYAVWAFLECLVYGGLIYGWSSLVFVLKDEGLYLELCASDHQNQSVVEDTDDNSELTVVPAASANASLSIYDTRTNAPAATETPETSAESCSARDSRLALIFTIGAAMFCVGCFILGQINFKFGTRISRIVATVLFCSGALMIAFTSNDVPWLIFPGLSLVGSGGIGYLVTNTQISIFFPSKGSLFVGIICGGFDASSGIQLLVKLAYENGFSRKASYLILAGTHLLTLISTFFFLPKGFIQKQPSPNRKPEYITDDFELTVELTDKHQEANNLRQQPIPKPQSLRSCLLSPTYLLHVLWLCILQLRLYFYLGSFNTILVTRLESDSEVSSYTNVSLYMFMGGILTSPFAGFVYDFQSRFFARSRTSLRRSLMPAVFPLALTTVLCIIMSALLLIEIPQVLYAVFFCVVFFRSFLYTLAAGYISAIFPSEYFCMMYGILILVGGIFSMFQYALFNWSEATDVQQVNLFLLALVFITFVHPLYQWWQSRKAERSSSFVEEK